MENPLAIIGFFLGLVASVVSGYFVHKFLYHKLRKNWLAFLLSLLGVFPLALILIVIGQILIIRPVPGPMGLGEAIGGGIGIAVFYGIFLSAGSALYLITIIISAVYLWVKKK